MPDLYTFSSHISPSSNKASLLLGAEGEHVLREQRTSQVICVASAWSASEGTCAAAAVGGTGSCGISPFDIMVGSRCFAVR